MTELFIPKHHTKVGVLVSSGKDSAYLLYLVCEYLRKENRTSNTTIVCGHMVDILRVKNSRDDFLNMMQEFENEYPEIEFVFDFREFVEQHRFSKEHNGRLLMKHMIEEMGVQTLYGGITQNLPDDKFEKVKELYGKEPPQTLRQRVVDSVKAEIKIFDDNFNRTDDIETCRLYKVNPIFQENSYTVYTEYKKSKFLREKIFPLTRSCVGGLFETDGWRVPCKKCWWCVEKKYIFGAYDGEQLV